MLQRATRKVAKAMEREPRLFGEIGAGQNGWGQWGVIPSFVFLTFEISQIDFFPFPALAVCASDRSYSWDNEHASFHGIFTTRFNCMR